jgi:hypothetical protein
MGEMTRVFVDGREIVGNEVVDVVNSVVLIGQRTRRMVMMVVSDHLYLGGWRVVVLMPPDVLEGPWRGYGA